MFLEKITSPKELKKLNLEELVLLCSEIRQRIVEVVSKNGGHLASSLGAVELITALHYCFDTPRDKLVFDVGHQAYAHKILTGRNKEFSTLRQYQGLSGFPSKKESEFDPFTTGHSSSAVSLALGLACARDTGLIKNGYFKVAAIIGDGSLSGGLCFEGLNNAGHLKKDLLVVLNTNELSIAPNVGALSTYLNKIISLPIYNRFKHSLESFVSSRIPKGSRIVKLANKFEEGLKGLFVPGMFFEELGFKYIGPLDGHNLNLLVATLNNIRKMKEPLLLHIVTKKGKGYLPAEKEPVRFHGVGPFDIKTGASLAKNTDKTYTEAFSEKLLQLAKQEKRITAITAAMPEGTGLDKFRDLYPERFFDVGIAEPHAVDFSAGLAKAGLKPVVAVYSTFLQRALDQIIEDVALQDLGVVFMVDRAGIVGEDGVTHQGIFDIAYLKLVPNLTLMAPKDAIELEMMLEFALNLNTPAAIRYPRDKAPNYKSQVTNEEIELGKPQILKEGKDCLIIALGSMVLPSLEAAVLLEKEGISAAVLNSRFVKPLDIPLLKSFSSKVKYVFTVEEGVLEGGFGSSVARGLEREVISIGLPCEFIPHGKRGELLEKYGLNSKGLADKIKSVLTAQG